MPISRNQIASGNFTLTDTNPRLGNVVGNHLYYVGYNSKNIRKYNLETGVDTLVRGGHYNEPHHIYVEPTETYAYVYAVDKIQKFTLASTATPTLLQTNSGMGAVTSSSTHHFVAGTYLSTLNRYTLEGTAAGTITVPNGHAYASTSTIRYASNYDKVAFMESNGKMYFMESGYTALEVHEYTYDATANTLTYAGPIRLQDRPSQTMYRFAATEGRFFVDATTGVSSIEYYNFIMPKTQVPVTPQEPTRTKNTVHIPVQTGVVYTNKANSTVLTGNVTVATDTTLTVIATAAAHPTPNTHEYVITGTSEWPYAYIAPVVTTGTETETEPIPYTTEYRDTAELKVGEERTIQAGVAGETTITYEVTYEDGVEVSRTEVSRVVSTAMVIEIIEQGTREPVITYETIVVRDIQGGGIYNDTANPNLYEGETRIVKEAVPSIADLTYEVKYEDGVEVSRTKTNTVVIQEHVPGEREYGTMPWPATMDVTAVQPLRSNNVITIPDTLGVDYVDISGGTEEPLAEEPVGSESSMVSMMTSGTMTSGVKVLAPGTHTLSSTAIIVPQAQTSDKTTFVLTNPYDAWPYEKYAAIIPPEPEEFERYVVIPESDTVEYFDGLTGEVFPGGTQRKIGAKLILNSRLIVNNAFLTNDAATWTYERTGGVTGLKPERLSDSTFKIPFHSQIEYVDKLTGTVLKHNNTGTPAVQPNTYFDIELSGLSPTGLMTVVPRAIDPAFLANPNEEWQFGIFRKGMEVLANLRPFNLETGYHDPIVDVDAQFADYLEVYIDGELLTNHQGPRPTPDVEHTIEIKVRKDLGHHRLALDWERGEQGEPTGIVLNWGTGATNWTAGSYLEWTGEDTLAGKFTWPSDRTYGFLQLEVRELDMYTYGKNFLRVFSVVGYNADGDFQIEPVRASTYLYPSDYDNFFDIIINGQKLDTSLLETPEPGSSSIMEMEPGYKEVRLRLTNPDFTWEDQATMIYKYDQGDGEKFAPFTTDPASGDLVWTGTWPENVQSVGLSIYPFMPERALFVELEKVHPYYDELSNIVEIPDHPVIEYYIRETNETLPPGPYQITRYTEIADRIKHNRRIEKVNGQYYIYRIQDDHRFWYYFTDITEGVYYVTALAPTQDGYMLTIPSVTGVLYWDMLEREYVSGTFDLRDRIYKEVLIKPIAAYSTYRLTNPDDVWGHTSNFDVYATRPSQTLNTVTIPVIKGIEYFNKATNVVLTGDVKITADIVIAARATGQYILMSTTNEWTFKWVFIETKRVTALAPTQDSNWLTIPTVTGVRYMNATGAELRGTMYIRTALTISVVPASEEYALNNPDATWSFEPVFTTQKEIIVMDQDPRLVIHINGTEVVTDVFAVDPGSVTRIVLSLLEDSEFSSTPFLKNVDGIELPFELVGDNRGATLEITFEDNVPIELHIGTITHLTKPLYFTGDNTYLEIRQAGAFVATVESGGTGRLFIDNSYDFSIIPVYGHEFDRPGYYTHDTVRTAIRSTGVKTASFNIPFIRGPIFIDMSAIELTEAVSPHERGFNNIYITEYETLNLVSEEMLTRKRDFLLEMTDLGDNLGGLTYDAQILINPHTYIINCVLMPFSVPFDNVANRERITLGYTELFASALRLREDVIRLDLGEIYTPPKYHNSYDYANTAVRLHLPFAQPLELDPAYAIDQTLRLEYIVDAYTGVATVNVRSSLVQDNIFFSTEVKIGTEVPFISMRDGSLIGGTEHRARLNNNVKVPYVEVVRNVPYEKDSPFNSLTRTTVNGLSGQLGHVTVHDIKLNMTTATAEEEAQLRNVLAAGIVIK